MPMLPLGGCCGCGCCWVMDKAISIKFRSCRKLRGDCDWLSENQFCDLIEKTLLGLSSYFIIGLSRRATVSVGVLIGQVCLFPALPCSGLIRIKRGRTHFFFSRRDYCRKCGTVRRGRRGGLGWWKTGTVDDMGLTVSKLRSC